MGADVNAATNLLLRLAEDSRFRRLFEQRATNRDLVGRFVAGESVSAALDVTGELLARGCLVSVGHLAPEPLDVTEAAQRRKKIRKVLRRLGQASFSRGGRVEVMVRPAVLGARLGGMGYEIALENAQGIADSAASIGARVTVASETGLPMDTTLALTDALRENHPDVGIELWSARRRTENDVRERIDAGCRVRLSHGGAGTRGEAPSSLLTPHDSDLAYVRSMTRLMRADVPFSVSAAERRIRDIAEAFETRGERPQGSFEYHLRMGADPLVQATIADRGDAMRVFVPFGDDWYPYLMARVAENPRQLAGMFRSRQDR